MTIRFRLTVWIIAVNPGSNSLLALVTAVWVGKRADRRSPDAVRLDLNSARGFITIIWIPANGRCVRFTCSRHLITSLDEISAIWRCF
jgi:hypothetical protein